MVDSPKLPNPDLANSGQSPKSPNPDLANSGQSPKSPNPDLANSGQRRLTWNGNVDDDSIPDYVDPPHVNTDNGGSGRHKMAS